ncbi:hypothetical protein GBA52_016294 [Prunus armeniaca]|nr:hypothetical protein GBA52_016294 [Prunus armeniaca]
MDSLQSLALDRRWLLAQIAYTCWSIWKNRWVAIFDGSLVCPRRSLRDTPRTIHEFLQLQCFPIEARDPTEGVV